MLLVQSHDLEKLHKALMDLDGPRGLPYAVSRSLNTCAFNTRKVWEREGRRTMNVRAVKSWPFRARIPKKKGGGKAHWVVKARIRKSINQMQSVAGNTHKFMAEQERGFSRRRSKGVQIPTIASRIGASIKRHQRRPFHRKNISLRSRRYDKDQGGFGGDPRRYAAAEIRMARRQGRKFVYLDFGNKRGIFRVPRKYEKEWSRNDMVWSMSAKSTRTRPNPMLRRTLHKLRPDYPLYHRQALEKQIKFVLEKRGFRVRGVNMLAEIQKFQAQG